MDKDTKRPSVQADVMCSDCGCKNKATHERPSWVKRNGWLPICKKHVGFYNAVGLGARILKPHNASLTLAGKESDT